MTPEQFERIADLFEQARGVEAAERAAFLDKECQGDESVRREIESLLEHHDKDNGVLSDDNQGLRIAHEFLSDEQDEDEVASDKMPQRVGRFTIVRLLGEGGMGSVYLATQDHPRREVALKLIRAELASSQIAKRFEFEAQVLGQLEHPNIARIYEADTADSARGMQPYFAMEYISGLRLDKYVQEARPTLNERLALVATICDAVHHAHQKGVVHRDLKPANILVDAEGQPKILDFGVARAIDSDLRNTTMQTDPGQLVGTLRYMSPEQISGDPMKVDTRSDIYCIGVILYEVLAGRMPYDVSTHSIVEAARVIQNEEPSSLSSFHPSYRGDVETIVAKALEKDMDRRYSSAAELAGDIRRYLTDQPITARPASAMYQLRKFARRNKPIVAGVSVAFLTLVVALFVVSISLVRAHDAELEAAKRLSETEIAQAESEAVQQFVAEMLTKADRAATDGDTLTVRDVLDNAAIRIDELDGENPLVEAAIRQIIGRTYSKIGAYAQATAHFEKALDLRRTNLETVDTRVADSEFDLAENLFHIEQDDRAETMVRESIARLRQQSNGPAYVLARQLYTLGRLLKRAGDLPAAADALQESIDLNQGENETDGERARALMELGTVLSRLRRHAEAEKMLRSALSLARAYHGRGGAHEAGILANLAVLLKRQGRYDEAVDISREALAVQESLHGSDHPATIGTLINLGSLLFAQARSDEAADLLRKAIGASERVHGTDSFHTAIAYGHLSQVLAKQRQYEEALIFGDKAKVSLESSFGPDHMHVATALVGIGECESRLGDFVAAQESLKKALAIYLDKGGEEHPWYASTMVSLAENQSAAGDLEAARESLTKACGLLEAGGKATQDGWSDCLTAWAGIEFDHGKLDVAQPLAEKAFDLFGSESQNYKLRTRQMILFARMNTARGQHEKARTDLLAYRDQLTSMSPVPSDQVKLIDDWLNDLEP